MYNQYTPYGYQPYYPSQRQYAPQVPQTPQMAQPQAQSQFETPFQDIKFVTDKQAEAYIVYPNSRVLLIDNEKGVAHIKTADGMGQCVTQYFKFAPINADGTPLKSETPQPQVDLSEYIKKTDLEALGFVTAEQFNQVVRQLDILQKQLANGRQSQPPRANQ
jgi:hypothetical protein